MMWRKKRHTELIVEVIDTTLVDQYEWSSPSMCYFDHPLCVVQGSRACPLLNSKGRLEDQGTAHWQGVWTAANPVMRRDIDLESPRKTQSARNSRCPTWLNWVTSENEFVEPRSTHLRLNTSMFLTATHVESGIIARGVPSLFQLL